MTLLVFGMDGAVREYVEEAVEKGMMPNMENIMEEGVFDDMDSSVPPITIPAWVSMFSGLHPDKLGVYHMTEMDQDYNINSVPSSKWKGRMFWDKLDGEFGLINVPGTSPTWSLNGYMFEGFPMVTNPSTYPENLKDDLPNFEFRSKDVGSTTAKDREAMIYNFRRRREIFNQIDGEVDVRVEVYQVTDTVAHRCSNRQQIIEMYAEVDEIIGERLEQYEDVLIVSDHGFTNVDKYFYINTWLQNNGFLTPENTDSEDTLIQKARELLSPLAETRLRPLLKKGNDLLSSSTGIDFSPKSFSPDQVDFSNTKAFSFRGGANNHGEININDERYSEPVVEDREHVKNKIIKKLSKVDEVDEVWDSSEVYDEPDEMPDIVFRVKEDVGLGVSLFPKEIFKTNAFIHSDTGIVAAKGKNFRSGDVEKAQLADVGPTIAKYLGQNMDADGQPLDIFDEEFEPIKPESQDFNGIDY